VKPEPAVPDAQLRVTVCEPALARYRLPTWQELSRRPGLKFHLEYASDGHVPNVEPVGIDAHFTPAKVVLKRPPFFWNPGSLATLDRLPADAIVFNWNVRVLSLPLAIRKARKKNCGVVLFGHGFSKNETAFRRRLRNWIGHKADCVLVYSESARQDLIADGFAPERVFVAPNSVDQTEIQAARQDWLSRPTDLAAFKRDNKLETGPVLIFVARLDPLRRLDMLLDALPTIAKAHPGVQLVVIGGGSELEPLKQQATRLGLNNEGADTAHGRVRFLGAVYGEPNIAPWFLSSDLMVFPSHMGLSALHAMGYGVPVITCNNASKHGPEFDVIRDVFGAPSTSPERERAGASPALAPNGATFRDEDTQDLAAKVIDLLNDRTRLQQLAASAHHTAAAQYSIPKMVDGFEAALRFAAARQGR
jgi:glycosyltransferase involved in cell wall biosynthesis